MFTKAHDFGVKIPNKYVSCHYPVLVFMFLLWDDTLLWKTPFQLGWTCRLQETLPGFWKRGGVGFFQGFPLRFVEKKGRVCNTLKAWNLNYIISCHIMSYHIILYHIMENQIISLINNSSIFRYNVILVHILWHVMHCDATFSSMFCVSK